VSEPPSDFAIDQMIREARREGARAAFLWMLDILAQGTTSPEKAAAAIEHIKEMGAKLDGGEPFTLGPEEL
jgi:hypothetical protein